MGYFDPLPTFGFDVIVVDPPWPFELWSERGKAKSGLAHYELMTLDDIFRLPIGHLARGDCLLLLWACGWLLPLALDVMRAWGFTYKSEIVWRKVFPSGKPRMGTGYRVRTMHEPILLGTIGSPTHAPFPSIFDGVAREHSRKPDEFYTLVRSHTPMTLRRADLFSRETRQGFEGWGREHGKFDAAVGAAA